MDWDDWLALATACGRHGIGRLFRSDPLPLRRGSSRARRPRRLDDDRGAGREHHASAARHARLTGDDDPDAFLASLPDTWIVGTVEDAVARLRELEAVGVQRVMAQHLLHDDLDALALLGEQVIPALR